MSEKTAGMVLLSRTGKETMKIKQSGNRICNLEKEEKLSDTYKKS